jgi:flagellar biosynthesis protein FliQ
MEELYFFWNAFNLVAILLGTVAIGLLAGAFLGGIISVMTQINDPALSFFSRMAGCALGIYFTAPFLFSSFQEFALAIWAQEGVYR